jgi:hypothetical protein
MKKATLNLLLEQAEITKDLWVFVCEFVYEDSMLQLQTASGPRQNFQE